MMQSGRAIHPARPSGSCTSLRGNDP